jgi:flavin reductase (DIM6/NTAB) family NADH-FMN oxidoreductase RutF
MSKMNIGKSVFSQPMPLALLGTHNDGKPNFMALGWFTRVNNNPPLFAVAVNKVHQTNASIRTNKTFTINFPSEDMLIETDYCGMVSAKRRDKSQIFDVFYGELENAPLITKCPLSIECKLYDTMELPTNDLFIGEVVGAYSDEKYLTGNNPDIKKINPIVFTMPDNNYFKIGEKVGDAWSDGKKFDLDQ